MGNTQYPILTRTVKINTNLSSKEYYFVNLHASVEDEVVIAGGATKPLFVLTEGANGATTEQAGTIALVGFCKLKAGGTVAPGDKLTSDANGKAVKTTTDTNNYGAICLEDGVDGDVVQVYLVQGMIAG